MEQSLPLRRVRERVDPSTGLATESHLRERLGRLVRRAPAGAPAEPPLPAAAPAPIR